MRIPILDLSQDITKHWAEYNEAIQGVLKSTQFIGGAETKAFEADVARYLGAKHAIGVNSGTDALVIALRALGVGPGHQVITSGFTFYATGEAVSLLGAEPVFVDIDPVTFNLNPTLVERHITSQTRAIIPVHLFGQSADLTPLLQLAERNQIAVVEDVAQAFGADYHGKRLGTLGRIGAYSFYPTKNLGAFGDGGLIVTDDDKLAVTCQELRSHGSLRQYYNEKLGYNSRLDSIQAAILRVKLKYVEAMNRSRQEVALRYGKLLADLKQVVPPIEADHGQHVYHQYTIRLKGGIRDKVQALMAEEGVSTMIYYPLTLPKLPVYSSNVRLPHAEAAASEVLSLPIWPEMDLSVQEKVVAALGRAIRSC